MLGASLHDILTRLKAQPNIYSAIDVLYSPSEPLTAPVTLTLPRNGLRLRFDGSDQRLRLIEVLDFTKTPLTYKNVDLVKLLDVTETQTSSELSSKPTGPAFRQVYHKLFGPTFAGEYLRTKEGSSGDFGTYILSYPGVALSFPLRNSAWTGNSDFVSVLSSSAALPAKCLTVFNGLSWKEAREDLYTRPCPHPRSLAFSGRPREGCPDEIELIKIRGHGYVEMLRRSSTPFLLVLNETTTQDLVAELGPPDAIYRKNDRRLSIHKARTRSRSAEQPTHSGTPVQFDGLSDNEQSSINTTTDESDSEDAPLTTRTSGVSTECFYNYFSHGFDVFVSCPSSPSPGLIPIEVEEEEMVRVPTTDRLVATKLLLHANVPGSYSFNRYRRARWFLDPEQVSVENATLNSESRFSIISSKLREVWSRTYTNDAEAKSLQRAMVLNRGWGDSPGSSCELLGGWEESADTVRKGTGQSTADSVSGLGNTELFGFPGLLFEVLKNDMVSCLTVY